jgi:hypothetical protein
MAVVFALMLTVVPLTGHTCVQCVTLQDENGNIRRACLNGFATGYKTCTLHTSGSCILPESEDCNEGKKDGGGGPGLTIGIGDLWAIGIWKSREEFCMIPTIDCFLGGWGLGGPKVGGPDLISPIFMRDAIAELDSFPAGDVKIYSAFIVLTAERTGIQDWRIGTNQFLSMSVWPRGNTLEVALCQGGSGPRENPSGLLMRTALTKNEVLVTPVVIDGERYVFTMHAKPKLTENETVEYLDAQQVNFFREVSQLPRFGFEPIIQRSGPVDSCNKIEPMPVIRVKDMRVISPEGLEFEP